MAEVSRDPKITINADQNKEGLDQSPQNLSSDLSPEVQQRVSKLHNLIEKGCELINPKTGFLSPEVLFNSKNEYIGYSGGTYPQILNLIDHGYLPGSTNSVDSDEHYDSLKPLIFFFRTPNSNLPYNEFTYQILHPNMDEDGSDIGYAASYAGSESSVKELINERLNTIVQEDSYADISVIKLLRCLSERANQQEVFPRNNIDESNGVLIFLKNDEDNIRLMQEDPTSGAPTNAFCIDATNGIHPEQIMAIVPLGSVERDSLCALFEACGLASSLPNLPKVNPALPEIPKDSEIMHACKIVSIEKNNNDGTLLLVLDTVEFGLRINATGHIPPNITKELKAGAMVEVAVAKEKDSYTKNYRFDIIDLKLSK